MNYTNASQYLVQFVLVRAKQMKSNVGVSLNFSVPLSKPDYRLPKKVASYWLSMKTKFYVNPVLSVTETANPQFLGKSSLTNK